MDSFLQDFIHPFLSWCLIYFMFFGMSSFRSSVADSAAYLPDQHINFRPSTLAKQTESINLKASKSMDLGENGWDNNGNPFFSPAVHFLLFFFKTCNLKKTMQRKHNGKYNDLSPRICCRIYWGPTRWYPGDG